MKKVHIKVIFDMTKDDCPVIEDLFYEYNGHWDLCRGEPFSDPSGFFEGLRPVEEAIVRPFTAPGEFEDPEVPEAGHPTPPGLDALEEFQLNQQGFMRIVDPSAPGNQRIVRIPENMLNSVLGVEGANQFRLNRNINLLTSQRLESALQGDLPVSPAFERGAEERERQAELRALRGPGAFSSAGGDIISETQTQNEELRERIRRGEITSGQAAVLQQQGLSGSQFSQLFSGLTANRFGTAQLGLQQQDLEVQLQIAQLLGQQGARAGQQQLIGTVAGAAIPGLVGFATGGPPGAAAAVAPSVRSNLRPPPQQPGRIV